MATPQDFFYMEAAERLERLSSGLLALERSPGDASLIGDLFREAHSLKGAAGVSGLTGICEVCHGMEDLLSCIREGKTPVGSKLVDALLEATDAVQIMVTAMAAGQDIDVDPGEVLGRLGGWDSPTETREEDHPSVSPDPSTPPTAAAAPVRAMATVTATVGEPVGATVTAEEPTVRLRVGMLEDLGNRTGELKVACDRLHQRLLGIRNLRGLVCSELNRHAADDAAQRILRPIGSAVHRLLVEFTTDTAVLDPLIDDIHEGVLEARMLPLKTLFDQLPRFVRQYCRQEDRQAEFHVEGGDTRVDRQVLEKLRDPMIHLIRNALCHGIETPAEREMRGKAATGSIRLTTSRHGDRIRIACEDDGRGIDRDSVLARAIEAGLISAVEAGELTDAQVNRLILRPGFSTADRITDVSGRGVGLDVVLSRIEQLQGALWIESDSGAFTRFVLEFPASVATLDGLLVEVEGHTYVIPTTTVLRTARVESTRVQIGAGGVALWKVDGRGIPVVMLADLLGLVSRLGHAPKAIPIVLVKYDDREVGLGVDRMLGTQTIVRKAVGEHIRGVPGVAGATILGTGLPALILEPTQLLQMRGTSMSARSPAGSTADIEEKLAPLLVVDDSITTRMMELSILECAGYAVDTAVSAEDALERIERQSYRLFVVDVEMPGLNGFQLTRRLRQVERFAETPIIIVSSLATEEHRREGLEAGANAYIVKGDFDQNSLLETVARLVAP